MLWCVCGHAAFTVTEIIIYNSKLFKYTIRKNNNIKRNDNLQFENIQLERITTLKEMIIYNLKIYN